jgi:hypothetical protein
MMVFSIENYCFHALELIALRANLRTAVSFPRSGGLKALTSLARGETPGKKKSKITTVCQVPCRRSPFHFAFQVYPPESLLDRQNSHKSPKSNPCQTSRTLIQTRNRGFGREMKAEGEKYNILSYQAI